MTPERSRLPVLGRTVAAALNRLAAASWSLPLHGAAGLTEAEQTGEEQIREAPGRPPLTIVFTAGSAEKPPDLSVELGSALGEAVLHLEAGFIDLLSDRLIPGWRDENPACLPLEWRAMLTLSHFEGTSLPLTAMTARRGLDAPRPQLPGPFLSGSVTAGGQHFGLTLELLSVSPAALDLPAPAGRDFELMDPGFCCRVRLARRVVTLDRYASLGIGDVVLSGRVADGLLPVLAAVEDIVTFQGGLDGDGHLTVVEVNPTGKKDPTMTETPAPEDDTMAEPAPETGPDAAGDGLETLPVELDIVLKSGRLALSDLRGLSAGATLDLKIDLDAPVTILANGAPMGRGQLVQIGTHVGVQITQWPARKRIRNG